MPYETPRKKRPAYRVVRIYEQTARRIEREAERMGRTFIKQADLMTQIVSVSTLPAPDGGNAPVVVEVTK